MKCPRDLRLKSRWIAMYEKEKSRTIFMQNKKMLLGEFRKLDLSVDDEVFLLLEDSLSVHVFTRDDAKRLASSSLKLQAGQQGRDSSQTQCDDGKTELRSFSGVLRKISAWALEIAMGEKRMGKMSLLSHSQMNAPRTKEDVLNVVSDKHERALVDNIVFPQVFSA